MDVRFTPAGQPLAVRYNGRIWAVMADPVHWFTRHAWWDTLRTAAVGSGDQLKRCQGQIIGLASNFALRTFTLRRDPLSNQWRLESITGGY